MSERSALFEGKKEQAHYMELEEPTYCHNPFIEALPPILTSDEVARKIIRSPVYSESERLKSVEFRLHAVQRLSSYIDILPQQLDLERRFSRMVRDGYKARNPICAEWIKQVRAGFKNIEIDEKNDFVYVPNPTSGFAIIGTSGIGKTTAINSVLSLYPQVIYHHEYNSNIFERVQLVWIKLDCPFDGGLRGVCLNFFQMVDRLVGTRYYEKYHRRTIDELIPLMGDLAAVSGLGVLVIDEIQRLSAAKSGGAERMQNFFIDLTDKIGVPVLQLGTFKALDFVSDCMANGRRNSGQGSEFWTNFAEGADWEFFLEGLWEYQWTNVKTELTPEIMAAMYEESQGITDIAKKLYMLTQWNVIGSGKETITPKTIRHVAKENLQLLRPMLIALKEKDYQKLREFKDIYINSEDLERAFQKSNNRTNLVGELNTIRNQRRASSAANEQDEILKELAAWLIDSGFEVDLAIKSAEETLKHYSMETDFGVVRKEAFRVALEKSSIKQDMKPAKPDTKQHKENITSGQNDLRKIVAAARKTGLTNYDALKKVGYIKNPAEFLALERSSSYANIVSHAATR